MGRSIIWLMAEEFFKSAMTSTAEVAFVSGFEIVVLLTEITEELGASSHFRQNSNFPQSSDWSRVHVVSAPPFCPRPRRSRKRACSWLRL